jgi:hypothetical protein
MTDITMLTDIANNAKDPIPKTPVGRLTRRLPRPASAPPPLLGSS